MCPPMTLDERRGLGRWGGRAVGGGGGGGRGVTNGPKRQTGTLVPNHVTELIANTFLRLKTNSVPSGTDTTEAPSTENKPFGIFCFLNNNLPFTSDEFNREGMNIYRQP